MSSISKNKYSLVALAVTSVLASSANAAGFKLFEQSTSAMGNAYAGRGAQITDASVAFTNPAALSQLKQAQWVVGLNVANVDGKFTNASGKSAQGMPISGPDSGSIGKTSPIPHFHYAKPLNDKWAVGFSVAVPFGTSSEYNDDFVGRYFAQETELKVIALQPSVSYQVNDKLSIGAAVALNYAQGTLSKFKDHSGLCELGAGINGQYTQLSRGTFTDVAQPAYCNSFYEVSGDDIKPSYTLGLHYQLTDSTKLGVSYHSAVKYTLKGDSKITNTPITGEFVQYADNPAQYWTVPTIPGVVDGSKLPVVDLTTGKLAVSPTKTEQSKLDLHTPQSAIISVDNQIDSQWSVQATATWTQWSKFTDISVLSNDTQTPISASTQQSQNLNADGYIGYIPEHWQDAWAFAVGATYQFNKTWTVKAGIAQDNSPVNSNYRSARIPANDRTWFTLGGHYQSQENWSLDFAAGVMVMKDTKFEDNEYNAQDMKIYNSSYQADYSINAYVVSMQFNYTL
ncbi:outer membrane protein transport protein [Psychrobium sp. MM17-31]|uniref:OmpP1/FadL family transporter n=1 Tax=Psychrobium sp. MM17-31 TaxID=2917758 RepID=UPI001EF6702B|nr:outer membrane protein transport protein [Psychrobium sp. MM17-31]MCG7530483.1 outer membrane protein transport protein [Psychrobium sp. MM17-31]